MKLSGHVSVDPHASKMPSLTQMTKDALFLSIMQNIFNICDTESVLCIVLVLLKTVDAIYTSDIIIITWFFSGSSYNDENTSHLIILVPVTIVIVVLLVVGFIFCYIYRFRLFCKYIHIYN